MDFSEFYNNHKDQWKCLQIKYGHFVCFNFNIRRINIFYIQRSLHDMVINIYANER